MQRSVVPASFLLSALALAAPREAPDPFAIPPRYSDPRYGLTLDLPQFPRASSGQAVTVLMAMAPPVGSFSSNLNVLIQEGAFTRAQYKELSESEFSKASFTVDSKRDLTVSGADAVLWEYHGQLQGRDLRWLALAVVTKDRVILTTCTATESEYLKLKPAFQKSIESFKLTPR